MRVSEEFDFVLEAAGRLGVLEQGNAIMRNWLLEWFFSGEYTWTAWRTEGRGWVDRLE